MRADDMFGTIECKARELFKCQDYKPSRQWKYAKLSPDDSSTSDAFAGQDSRSKFKFRTFFSIVDTLHNEPKRRRATYADFYNQFKVVFPLFRHVRQRNRRLCWSTHCESVDLSSPDELAPFLHFISKQPKQSPQYMLRILRIIT